MAYCSSLSRRGYCTLAGCSDAHCSVCDICDGIQLVTDPNTHYLSRKHLSTVYEKGARDAKRCLACNVALDNAFSFTGHYMSAYHRTTTTNQGTSPYAILSPTAHRRCHPCNRMIPNHTWGPHIAGQSHRQKTTPTQVKTIASGIFTDFGYILGASGSSTKSIEIILPSDVSTSTLEVQMLSPQTPSP